MRSATPCSLLLSFLLAGCGSTPDATATAGDTTGASTEAESTGAPATTGAPETTGAPACTPGYEGCPCMDGVCLQGLSCFSDLCVDVGGETSVDPESSGAPAESSSSQDGGPESSTSTAAESSSESSSTMLEPACTDGEVTCEGATLTTCVDETPTDESCDDVCAATGFTSSGCADAESCACDGYLDGTCELGTSGYCYCLEQQGGGVCDTALFDMVYGLCFDGSEPGVACLASYDTGGGTFACDAAINACF